MSRIRENNNCRERPKPTVDFEGENGIFFFNQEDETFSQ